MNWFSGFGFRDEEVLFSAWRRLGRFSVGGFSLGAIRAFEYAVQEGVRVDRLELFSPAFFHGKSERYLKVQMDGFARDTEGYRRQFEANCIWPCEEVNLSAYRAPMAPEELQMLLSYRWEPERLRVLIERGTQIVVYLGGQDRIIDGARAFEFFSALCETWLIKEAGHLLMEKR